MNRNRRLSSFAMPGIGLMGLVVLILTGLLSSACSNKDVKRSEVSLNGKWMITMSDTDSGIPESFASIVPVPGLVDMAEPVLPYPDSGYFNKIFWYKRQLPEIDRSREVILLRINKARYHTRVWINGELAGENIYSFTPSVIDIKPFLRQDSEQNEILIAVGCRNNLPDTVTNGWDFEKIKYIPGIYDDVKIISADHPYINNVQIAPDIIKHLINVRAEIEHGDAKRIPVEFEVSEARSGKVVTNGKYIHSKEKDDKITVVDMMINIDSCHLWSPDDPFLYDLRLSTGADTKTTRFGMRSFRASADSGIFLLNGMPYYMRGTNVCIYRFFEDPQRSDLPWDDKWVTALHAKFRDMHWTTIRYCIGFPPERWYEIADSLGFLIQDEFPLWTLSKPNYEKYLGNLNAKQLAAEYREWMRDRWNHPCVVIWDAQNESMTDTTARAINMVRSLDLSGRPWDNGWAIPASEIDAIESHPYLFSRYQHQKPAKGGYLKELFSEVRIPGNDPNSHYPLADGKRYENPVILNEYGWIWLNRNGSTTTLTDEVYMNVWPWAKTEEQRLEIYAKTLGILTEYWRTHRKAAAVMHFCGLGYSRAEEPRGQTSDHFVDIKDLTYEPNFYKYVRPAFSPVGIMVEFWEESVRKGVELTVPVHIINDTYTDFSDSLKISLTQGNKKVFHSSIPVQVTGLEKHISRITVSVPFTGGKCSLEAEITYNGQKIRSIREFMIAF